MRGTCMLEFVIFLMDHVCIFICMESYRDRYVYNRRYVLKIEIKWVHNKRLLPEIFELNIKMGLWGSREEDDYMKINKNI